MSGRGKNKNDVQSQRTYPPELSSRRGDRQPLPDRVGRAERPRAGAGDRLGAGRIGPQRHRRARRRLFALSRAGHLVGGDECGLATGPDRYPSNPSVRAVRPVAEPREDRVAGPVGTSGGGRLQGRDPGRRRHPPDHCGHQGAADLAGDQPGDRRRAAEHRRDDRAREPGRGGDQGGARSGLVSAGHRRTVRGDGDGASADALRGDRRHVRRPRDAAGHQGLFAADRGDHPLCLRRPGQDRRSDPAADLPRARRVQRLGRVRLGHLHLPALSDPRHRGVRARGAVGRRGADRL